MTTYKQYNVNSSGKNPLGSFGPIIALVVFLFLLSFVVKGIFTILSWVAPLLLIITLIMDHKVVVDYGKFILRLIKENPLVGILGAILTFFGFPAVVGFLFFKALAKRTIKSKIQDIEQKRQGDYTDYEEVTEDDEDFLELPSIEKSKSTTNRGRSTSTNEYEDLFD